MRGHQALGFVLPVRGPDGCRDAGKRGVDDITIATGAGVKRSLKLTQAVRYCRPRAWVFLSLSADAVRRLSPD